tara:strand:+ start:84 stop:578 length:495 start_codon:yes stop_codon:yes gene_type:complete
MFINKLIKKPILPIAFLLTYLLIHQLEEKKIINLSERAEILKATSCRAVLVNLKRRVPKDWLTSCENNILTIEVEKPIKKLKNQKNYKAYLYRELANDIIFTAKSSPVDTLENVTLARFIVKSEKLIIKAAIFGDDLVKFTTMKNKRLILNHFKKTVKVKELFK